MVVQGGVQHLLKTSQEWGVGAHVCLQCSHLVPLTARSSLFLTAAQMLTLELRDAVAYAVAWGLVQAGAPSDAIVQASSQC